MADPLDLNVRELSAGDRDALLAMWHALWPDDDPAEHAQEVDARIAGKPPSTLPLTTFIAEDAGGHAIGFVEVGLRSHADGCDPARAVAFIEGWYVAPD